MKGMIRSVHDKKLGTLAQSGTQRPEVLEIRQWITRALKEQYRYSDIEQVTAAFYRRFPGRVQREAEKN
jgi:ATP-dependent helicase/DNAse subunit B